MSESMSSPWIRDYFTNVAETYGAQLYNAPALSGKKKVQLTDFLTYQENSYIWAWISDKDHKVSVRISKDAVGMYKRNHSRNIVDCRFSVVVISNYRPMFSPRPLGPNMTGNTPVSHISLEIDHVRSVGIGGHLFGSPRDLELDENMKEWVFGLRQDGGGGNVLKLRKQQEPVQNAIVSPSPPPFSLYAPISQRPAAIATEDTAKTKPEQPRDFKRVYAKRWRMIELNPWKFVNNPATDERPNRYPTPPYRTPSPTSRPQQQGTPTDWSPSNRGSPVAPDRAATPEIGLGDEIRRHDEAEVLPTTPNVPTDTEGHSTVDVTIAATPDTHSPQPPTPAQRIKHSPPPPSTSPTRSSPEVFAPSCPLPSQQLPASSPPTPTPSLPLSLPSLPISMSIRRNIQRKVPHPGLPSALPDPTKQGPAQILVPNSDTSGMGSSQSYPQSQHPSQSQRQLSSHSPVFPSSLSVDFKPPDASTPREDWLGSSPRRTSKMFADPLPTHCDVEEQKASLNDKCHAEKTESDMERQEELDSTRPPAPTPSARGVETPEVETLDSAEDTDQLQLINSTARSEAGFGALNRTEDTSKGGADADHEDNHPTVNKMHPAPQSGPPRQYPCLSAPSIAQCPPSIEQDANGVSIHHFPESFDRPGSQSSMHSLFSDILEDECTTSPHGPAHPVSQPEDKAQKQVGSPKAPRHDSDAWKEPSFLARNKGKDTARAVRESPRVGKKRVRSAQPESPLAKKVKAIARECQAALCQTTTETTQRQDIEATACGKMASSNRPSTSPTDTAEKMLLLAAVQSSKPRLVNLVVDFERIDAGKRLPIPVIDMDKDVRSMLLRTGRIRTLGEEVEKNGSIYIMRR